MAQTQSTTPGRIVVDNVSVTVPAVGDTTILEMIVDDASFMGFSIKALAQALDAFKVQGRMSPDDDYQTLYSDPPHYTTPAGLVVDASGDLTALGAGASGWLLLNVLPLYSIRILASAAADSAIVTIRAIARS